MAFDGVFIYHLINELKEKFIHSRIEKVFQPNKDSFVFQTYLDKKRNLLKIDLNPHSNGIYLTEKKYVQHESNQFFLSIRKFLEGGIIKDIYQHHTDRVIILEITTYDFLEGPMTKQLIFEAMGKHSNLYLVKDGIIIDCFKKSFSLTLRQLMPKAQFEFFPSSKKSFLDYEFDHYTDFKEITNQYEGVSSLLAKYLLNHPEVKIKDISLNPTLSLSDHKFYFFNIFDHNNVKSFETLSQLLDYEFKKEVVKNDKTIKLFIENQLKKQIKKKAVLSQQKLTAEKNLVYKEHADFLYENCFDLNIKLSSFKHIELDEMLTINQNAQKFYKLYHKAKRTIEHMNHYINEVSDLITWYEDLLASLSFISDQDLEDLEAELMPLGFTTSKKSVSKKKKGLSILNFPFLDGHIYIGKSSNQNEYLVSQIARRNDYWFHIKDGSGSHVIYKGDSLNEEIIRTCSMLAAYFSSFKNSSSIPVDYTMVKNLKKIPGKPGYQLSYTHHKTIYIDIIKETVEKLIIKQ
ncbi:MAG: fibronectin-binding domain-containing protein [Candidatus Phytoplasma sp.]|nr:fibronectin-binding domain-containing protein [Phytoplasma sp.]